MHFNGFLNSLSGLIGNSLYGENPTDVQIQFIKDELVNLTGDLSTSTSALNNNVDRRVIDFITEDEFDI